MNNNFEYIILHFKSYNTLMRTFNLCRWHCISFIKSNYKISRKCYIFNDILVDTMYILYTINI